MSSNNKVEEYFNRLGIEDIDNPEMFWDYLENKYGNDTCVMLDNAMNNRGDRKSLGRIYTVKNKSLDLSLDFATYSKDLYRRYLNWVAELNLNPKKILDVACDNGIVTCFYGILYPEADVVGIDIGGNSIKCAKELAEKLELNNVRFEQIDVKNLKKIFTKSEFDLITSVRSLKEIFDLPNDIRVWNLKEADKIQIPKKQIISITKLGEYLEEDGLFLTFERLASAEEQVYFNNLFNEAGFSLDKDISPMINFHELGDNQIMPLFAYRKGDSIESSYDLILNNYEGNKNVFNYEKFINSYKEEDLILGLQVNYVNGSGKMRHELWRNEDNLLFIKYSNLGYREFENYSKDKIDEVKAIIQEEKETMTMYGQRVYEYFTVEERGKIK